MWDRLQPTSPLGPVILAASLLVTIAGYGAGLPADTAMAAGLCVFAIAFWATGVISEFLTALIFLSVAMLVSVAPAGVIFSGFQSKAFWLVFGGLIIGIALNRSGLGAFIAARMTARFNASYPAAVTGVVLMGTVLAFVMPSTMGRVLLIVPVTLAIAGQLGFDKTGRGRAGLVLAAGIGTYLPGAALLPATVPGMVMVGAAETQYGIVLTYTDWFWRHFPVFGVLKLPLLIAVTTCLFAERPKPFDPAGGALSPDARLLALLLPIALALWATDALHGISPAWVSLAFGVICLLPQTGLVPGKVFAADFQLGPLLFIGAILGLGALVDHSGLGSRLAAALLKILPLAPGEALQNYASLFGLNTVVGIVASFPGLAAVMTPLAASLAEATGWPVETVLHTQIIAFAGLLLPYQTPPVLVAATMGGVGLMTATRYLLILWALSTVILVPLHFVWWRLIGVL